MFENKVVSLILVILMTLASGIVDAQGALWASRIWDNNRLNIDALIRASLGFGTGLVIYFIMIRFLRNIGIVSPEIQTVIYMVVMVLAVALVSRQFFAWQAIDQVVAVAVIGGLIWLVVRTGAG